MIEQLQSAGDQLREAWNNYLDVYSTLQSRQAPGYQSHKLGFLPKFSSQLDTELAFISSYESKIQDIKASIARARNYSLGLAPVNSLPPEILTCIFQLLLPTRQCDLYNLSSRSEYCPSYPDNLTHVCSHWRRIAVSCCSLWCHIDLTLYEPFYDMLLARAETHITRADQLPIELHIAEFTGYPSEMPHAEYNDLYDLVSRVADRVETLNLFAGSHIRGVHRSIFKILLLTPHPRLTKLIMHSEYLFDAFIIAKYFDEDHSSYESQQFTVDLTNTQIENSFASLTMLDLQGIFPSWSSTAYSGLVDLRLLSNAHYWSDIKAAELISILKSSPSLQILHFGFRIEVSTSELKEVDPIPLHDLQVVKIFPDLEGADKCPSNVLQFLAPGSRPLRLSFGGRYAPGYLPLAGWESFFARSKVTAFHTCSILPPMSVLLRYSTQIQYAIFEMQDSSFSKKIDPTHLGGITLLPHLRSLHVISSTLLEDDLRFLLECCPNGITLYSSHVARDEGAGYALLGAEELSSTFPTVKISDHPPYPLKDPTASWDLLD